MKRIIVILIASLLLCGYTPEASANDFWSKVSSWFAINKQPKKVTPADTVHIDITQLTLEENLSIPEVGKQQRKIRAAQDKEMRRLQKVKLTDLSLMRNYEVIKATIAASNLFLPNDTALNSRADLYLRPFLKDLRISGYYHVMLVMHSDDTGSEAYSTDLTRARVHAVKDWLQKNGGNTDFVVTYEAGAFTPIATNETIEGRARNRRLEIYLIPGPKMIEMAQQNKLEE